MLPNSTLAQAASAAQADILHASPVGPPAHRQEESVVGLKHLDKQPHCFMMPGIFGETGMMSAILFRNEVNFSLKHIIQGKTAQRNQFFLSLSNRLLLFVWGRRVFGGLLGVFEVTCPLKGRETW